jgi:hypothetical protein
MMGAAALVHQTTHMLDVLRIPFGEIDSIIPRATK